MFAPGTGVMAFSDSDFKRHNVLLGIKGFSAKAGANRITFDSCDGSGLGDATVEERELTAS